MKILTPILAVAALWPAAAHTCDDHVGKCEIEDWNHSYTPAMQALVIDGVATCDSGRIRLRLYDGEGATRKFVGVERAFIRGHIFKAMTLQVARPHALSIKYSIQPE